jgi:restriction system protein
MATNEMPSYDSCFNPVLSALRILGGSGSIQEIYDKVVEQEKYSDEVLAVVHEPDKSTQTEIAYRLTWARTYLKKYGLLENSARGVWSLTPKGNKVEGIDPREVVKTVRGLAKKEDSKSEPEMAVSAEVNAEEGWRQELYQVLTQKLDPVAFERLVQRVLRESGFTQVEVTNRTNDGGIDGKGIARIHGLLSFHVLFQCKRYRGSVGAPEIRDFRGAMVGRTDKGLFITTGTFTPAAVKEATRDGAPAIDLVDGNELSNKLREMSLGIRTKMIEVITVDHAWFEAI